MNDVAMVAGPGGVASPETRHGQPQRQRSGALVIGPVSRTVLDGIATVSSRIELPTTAHDLWFRAPSDAATTNTVDPFLIACLPTAMALRLPVVVQAGTVSRQLMANLPAVQAILRHWHRDLTSVDITAAASEAKAAGQGLATFFSGGVDSFYTTLKHRERLSSLVLVHGFDIALENTILRERVRGNLMRAAASLGLRLIEVETNQRTLTDPFVSWPLIQFGPALASVGVLLAGAAREVLIPASESYAHLDPCGSHPLLDPLWSTEAVAIRHDGAEATRNEKIAFIGRTPAVLSSLRVCWENRDNAYNCGRCEKCLRTMIALEAAGLLSQCQTFDVPLTAANVRRMSIPMDLMYHHVEENLRALRSAGRDGRLVRALEHAVARYQAASIASRLGRLGVSRWPLVVWSLGRAAVARLSRRR
jgi:hypothetical protein